jgi:CPA1 family monovalent cation:H+ antiporter
MLLRECTLFLSAVPLLHVSRKLGTPYPSMLPLAGACVAALPRAPKLVIEPRLALTLFVAPALFAAAYDTPPRESMWQWLPLLSMVVFAVALTTAGVASFALALAGLPLAAAVALGLLSRPRPQRQQRPS